MLGEFKFKQRIDKELHMDRTAPTFNFSAQPKLTNGLKYLGIFGVIYLVFIFVYSVFYWQFVSKLSTDFIDHVLWWLKNTGVWYLFAPICLVYFSYYSGRQSLIKCFLTVGFPMVLSSVILQISFDYSYLKADLFGYFVLYLPKQIGIFMITCLYWYLFVMDDKNTAINVCDEPTTKSEYINLEHKGRPYKLDMESIWFIKSAGNYIEIESIHGQFLKRSSLKKIQLDAPSYFCQCHRSTLVNLKHICALSNQASGHAIATLSNGSEINISKRYKNSIKEQLIDYPIKAR